MSLAFRCLVVAIWLASISNVRAHEVKVLASKLAVDKAGGKSTIFISWGHRLPVDDLIDAESVDRYELLTPDGKNSPLKTLAGSMQENSVELPFAGNYQVVACRKPSVYTYVIDEMGERVLKPGSKHDHANAQIDLSQRSVQCAKAVIVVGPPGSPPVAPVGLPIEIVPMEGPAAWRSQSLLRFQVLLDGKPLRAADMTARYVGFKPESGWCYATTTDRDGVATVLPSQAGTWILKVNNKRLAAAKVRDEYDLESYTATLAIEIQP